jgi:hypothetical protein
MAVTINIPSQVKTYANLAAFPASGSLKTIYIAEDTNKTYRWTGSVYVEISGADFSGYVPTSRTLTINGTTQDLSANRTFTIPTDLTVGTTPISSGTIGRVLFQGTGNVLQQSGNLFWNNTTNRLGIGTATPTAPIHILYNPASQNGINIDATANNVNHIGFLREGALYGRFGINASSGEFRWDCGAGLGSYFATIYTGNAERLRIFTDGNLGLNTSTNAGFRLDVNGTARVSGNLTFAFTTTYITTSNTGGGINAGVNTFFNNGATWIDDTSVRALDITYNNGIKIANTTRYPLSLGTSSKAVASAQLEMVSTTQGFLPPRMTTTQRNAIASPAAGLVVYDNTDNKHYGYNGTTWNAFY